jgi:hypothetical protein
MKSLIPFFCRVSALPLAAVLADPQLAAGNTVPTVPEAPPGALQSVFSPQPGFGKDPFFPNSTRLRPVLPVPSRGPAAPLTGVPDSITLKGLAVLNQRKLAIINNCTVESGEEFMTKVNGHALKGKCIEIKTNSVIIEMNGSTKELQLRPGI